MPNNLNASTLIVTMSTHHFPNAVSTEEVMVKKTTNIHIASHKIHTILTSIQDAPIKMNQLNHSQKDKTQEEVLTQIELSLEERVQKAQENTA